MIPIDVKQARSGTSFNMPSYQVVTLWTLVKNWEPCMQPNAIYRSNKYRCGLFQAV